LLRFRCEQPWYSIFSREIERYVLPICRRYGMGAIVWSPLDGGWLSGRYRKPEDLKEDSRVVQGMQRRGGGFDPEAELIKTKLTLVGKLSAVAEEAGMPLTHMAIAFTLEHPAVTSTIIGPRTYEQLEDLLACADVRLDGQVIDRIDALVPPGTNVNPIDMTSRPAGLTKRHRRRR
jgi:aryl-alcohol dehydrogenase (NADP+)